MVAQDSETGARAGVLHTPHGEVETPVFMPVGTQATVKTLSQEDLESLDARIILGNTYHLYLRPGAELIAETGGLHGFMGWDRAILTDSGGYQVRSLADLNRITEEGVVFQSHIDGSKHLFTPESVIRTQHLLGPDVMMIFDECNEFPCKEEYARQSGERTLRWAEQCMKTYDSLGRRSAVGREQALFGIVQGSIYPNLRERFADAIVAMDFPGYAVGGTCMGEDKVDTWRAIESVVERLPVEKPRYMMGSGPPNDLVDGVMRGIDMFDCVIPTRNARNGSVFLPEGRLTIRNAKFKHDLAPLSPDCPLISRYSRAYVRHLFNAKEMLGLRIASIASTDYFLSIMREMRSSIIAGIFADWRATFIEGPYGKDLKN
ncbi:MAG: tRNA guanosine(34) transglycosylase Tgt [Candidatus Latescibacterota bacterium]|nr:tRNA guanosine(34) transglycosylase Tgt [Candidatus Latescibacterota bacterium]